MTAVADRVSDAIVLLRIEECDAWFEYLAATQPLHPLRYEEVEPSAWKRLTARLKAIAARRAELA